MAVNRVASAADRDMVVWWCDADGEGKRREIKVNGYSNSPNQSYVL